MDIVQARAFITERRYIEAMTRAETHAFRVAFGELVRKTTQSGRVDDQTVNAIEHHAVDVAIEFVRNSADDGVMSVAFVEHVRTTLHDRFAQAAGRI